MQFNAKNNNNIKSSNNKIALKKNFYSIDDSRTCNKVKLYVLGSTF